MVMSWEDKNIFITGADGFIGAWLVKRFAEKKANVIALFKDIKRQSTYKLFNLKGKAIQIQGDITDYKFLKRVLDEYSIDTCFHLAAQALVQLANQNPLFTFESNIKGTWNILEAARNTKTLERVIVASSDKAYGVQKKLPYTEESPLLGAYPYDASKACTDILACCYAKSYNLSIAVTRCANTYGGGDLNFSRIIPDATRCILQEKEFLIRSDGTPERDYIYIEDVVDGYITLAEHLGQEEVKGQAFNFGTGNPISVISLFNKIAQMCDQPQAKYKILGVAKNEIDRQYLAIDKAGKILNWRPEYTLEKGLKATVAWYRKYFGK